MEFGFLWQKIFMTEIFHWKVSFGSKELLGLDVQIIIDQCQNRWSKCFLDHWLVTPFGGSEFSFLFGNGNTKLPKPWQGMKTTSCPSVVGEGLIPAIRIFLAHHKYK